LQDRKQRSHQKERRADVHSEQSVEILDAGILDGRGLGDARVCDDNVGAFPTMLWTCLARLCGPSGAATSGAMASARPPALWISATTALASLVPRP
jgi:hypothetical protein